MDRRTVRSAQSKATLKTAFLELFQTEEPDQITVVKLCEKAGLNRSTFYAHYEFMDQLIREVLWESVEEVFDGLALAVTHRVHCSKHGFGDELVT